MKMRRRIVAIPLALLLSGTFLFSACGGAQKNETKELAAYDSAEMEASEGYSVSEAPAEEAPAEYNSDTEMLAKAGSSASAPDMAKVTQVSKLNETLKIIRTATISVWCEDIADAYRRVERKGIDLGGYVADASYSGNVNAQQHSVTFRIPAENFDLFMNAARELGELQDEKINSDDVTDSYHDSKTRVATKRIKLARLEALLEKAEKLEDILRLEKEINDVTEEIEGLEGTLKRYDKLVAYSTITIDLMQIPEEYEEVVAAEDAFGSRFGDAAEETWKFAVKAAQGTVLFLLRALPALIVIAVILLILRVVYRRQQRNAANNAHTMGQPRTVANRFVKNSTTQVSPPVGKVPDKDDEK